jgi:hypothetical protein
MRVPQPPPRSIRPRRRSHRRTRPASHRARAVALTSTEIAATLFVSTRPTSLRIPKKGEQGQLYAPARVEAGDPLNFVPVWRLRLWFFSLPETQATPSILAELPPSGWFAGHRRKPLNTERHLFLWAESRLAALSAERCLGRSRACAQKAELFAHQ